MSLEIIAHDMIFDGGRKWQFPKNRFTQECYLNEAEQRSPETLPHRVFIFLLGPFSLIARPIR